MGQELSKKFHSIEQTELQNQLLLSLERLPILPPTQLLRGLRDGTATHPRRRPRTNNAHPILIGTEMRSIHRVAVLSDANFAPIYPLSHPPQSVRVHSRNDSGDTCGRVQDLVMDGLVTDLGSGERALALRHQSRRLQLNDPSHERIMSHSGSGRMDRDDLVAHLLVVGGGIGDVIDIDPSQRILDILGACDASAWPPKDIMNERREGRRERVRV